MSYDVIERIDSLVGYQNSWRMECLNLIASENVMSPLARRVYDSDFMHRYAEGKPGKRFYQGTNNIDELELMGIGLAKKLFGAEHVDLRPTTGSEANRTVFEAYARPGDKIMSYSTPAGGHFTHNSGARRYGFETYSYPLTDDGFHLDINNAKETIKRVKPKFLILGKSMFLFPEPVKELREAFNIPIIYDAAHVLGLIAGGKFQDPLREGASVVTASTHKTFFGPQGGIVYAGEMKEKEWEKIEKSISETVSNHHLHRIPAFNITTLEFLAFGKEYADQVVRNAKALARALHKRFDVKCPEYDFTESHQIAIDVAEYGGGKIVAENCERNNIILNKNLLPYEKPTIKELDNPRGIRIGVQEMTRFGMKEAEMEQIAKFLEKIIIKGKDLKEEVKRFRALYSEMKYVYDPSFIRT